VFFLKLIEHGVDGE